MTDIVSLDEGYSTTRLLTKEKPEIINTPEDKFETVLFLPEGENRKGEGGLRTKGYFKKSFDDKPLISIITVVFNGEKYLEETIQSVINQTYSNVEYIIIDGGSSDGTLDIIKKYEERIDYWVSEKDNGIYDAMNKGIDIASGEWLNFMNAGDSFYDQGVLAKAFDGDTADLDLIYGASIVTGGASDILLKPKEFTKLNLFFWNTRVVCHQAMFVKKTKAVKYSLKYKLKGELNWYLDLVANIKNYKLSDQPFVYYSLGGLSDQMFELEVKEGIKVLWNQNKVLFLIGLPIYLYKIIKKIRS